MKLGYLIPIFKKCDSVKSAKHMCYKSICETSWKNSESTVGKAVCSGWGAMWIYTEEILYWSHFYPETTYKKSNRLSGKTRLDLYRPWKSLQWCALQIVMRILEEDWHWQWYSQCPYRSNRCQIKIDSLLSRECEKELLHTKMLHVPHTIKNLHWRMSKGLDEKMGEG